MESTKLHNQSEVIVQFSDALINNGRSITLPLHKVAGEYGYQSFEDFKRYCNDHTYIEIEVRHQKIQDTAKVAEFLSGNGNIYELHRFFKKSPINQNHEFLTCYLIDKYRSQNIQPIDFFE